MSKAGEPLVILCDDGIPLHGHFFTAAEPIGVVVVAAATGVLARYYHRYAAFLSENGLSALTFDYRGIGLSRGGELRGRRIGWADWGQLDIDAALGCARAKVPDVPLMAVGHSIGGVLIGAASRAKELNRVLTVGAQYAYWRDYAPRSRLSMLLRWNIAMPAITLAYGYFPGRRLGWLEDLPAGVVNNWAFHGASLASAFPRRGQHDVLDRYRAMTAPMVAVHVADDEFTSIEGIKRTLNYYVGSHRQLAVLESGYRGQKTLGHFGMFHDRNREGFWADALTWLKHGTPWWPSLGALLVSDRPPGDRDGKHVS